MIEIWKNINGYEDLYQVSNLGNIRSVDRTYCQKSSHKTMMCKRYKGKTITPTDNGNGYLIVSLRRINEKKKNFYVHRLVAEHFLQNPSNLKEINHKDYNKKNNNVENLEWVTRKENVVYSIKHMEKQRTKSKQTSTGEKYITIKNGLWRLNIQRKSLRIDKLYKSFEEAVKAKEAILCG